MDIVRPDREVYHAAVQFEVVSSYDLLISMAAAANPGRFDISISWAREVRQALAAPLRRDLMRFFGGPVSLGIGPIQLIPDLPGADDPVRLVTAIADLDVEEFIVGLLGRRAAGKDLVPALRRKVRGKGVTDADEASLERYAVSLTADTQRRFWEILRKPCEAHERYVALVRAHVAGWFQSQYPGVLPILLQRAKQGRRSIGKIPARELVFRVTGGFTLQPSGVHSVTLVPSYYASPFVFVIRDGQDAILVYGARPTEGNVSHSLIDTQTIKVLKALSDETRLRILQLLAQQPLYGQQLADRLKVSSPTISHHMAQLRIAGLTRTELAEDGSQTYSVRPETVESLCIQLREALIPNRTSERVDE